MPTAQSAHLTKDVCPSHRFRLPILLTRYGDDAFGALYIAKLSLGRFFRFPRKGDGLNNVAVDDVARGMLEALTGAEDEVPKVVHLTADEVDPEYGAELRRVAALGVEVMAWRAAVGVDGIDLVDELPVVL